MAITFTSLIGLSITTNAKSYEKPKKLLFQNNKIGYKTLNIQRDSKLCKDEDLKDQNCPIDLYIDDFKAGIFYINNKAKYHLNQDEHILLAKNCLNNCSNNELKINLKNELKNVTYILSIDQNSNPIIINK